ncbi:MAG: PEP-CTERM sorting domain-containing protein [Acidobacteriia bacterium]|nr:PEP-CTERM sorting domain-containing protein [Terriglobia bacterium]
MFNFRIAVLTGVFALIASVPGWADQVTGTLTFGGGSTNFYDPANGYVPIGYLNKTQGPTVTVGAGTEFGFSDGSNTDTADFTGGILTLTDIDLSGAGTWQQTFTDTAFTGATILKTSDTFANGLTYGLVGDVLTVNWGGASGPKTFTATFSITPASSGAVPEPSALVLLLVGLGALGFLANRFKPVTG